MEHTFEELMSMLNEKIKYGQELDVRLQSIQDLDGVPKLQKKLWQEIDFLKGLQKTKKVKLVQLTCSNLQHIGGLVECASRPGTVSVCKKFLMDDYNKLTVDVVSDEGKMWTKVIARNPKALTAVALGQGTYGTRTVIHQAKDYLQCAKLNPHMYKTPKVVFEFFCGVEQSIAEKLIARGIHVQGDILPNSNQNVPSDESDSSEEEFCEESSHTSEDLSECTVKSADIEVDTLNLDVTTMMAYVSNMTNGYCHFVFKQEVLTQQAAWEAMRPVKPILEKLFEGKSLVCCKTAWDSFINIVDLLGGPAEKGRAAQLKQMLTIYEDDFGGEDDLLRKNLKVKGNVRERSKTVFNFGHRIKALNVSANEGFVRAAAQQGVNYAAFIHESRALTEGKEATATPIQLS